MNPVDLTRLLIGIPSVSGEEAEISRFLARYLEGLGYRVELQAVADHRANLIAVATKKPCFVFSTHLDTVSPYLELHEDQDFLYGRGACDAKGIIAAQIAAAESLRAEGFHSLGLLFLVDEERGSLGARAANKHHLASSCHFLIDGEPTDNKLAIGSKGSLRAVIQAKGRAMHSAYSERNDSAIEKLLDALDKVRRIDWPQNDLLGKTTCHLGTLSGGTEANVVAAEARAGLQIRLVTDSQTVKQLLEHAISGLAEVEYLSVSEPVYLLSRSGFEPCVVRFTTDIPHLTNWGVPLLMGPGSILDAHTEQERISKRHLVEAVDLYTKLVRSLTARESVVEESGQAGGSPP